MDIVIESNSKITVYVEDNYKPTYIYVLSKAKLSVVFSDSKVVNSFVYVKKGTYSIKRQVEYKPRSF